MKRKRIVAGNWKMNLNSNDAKVLVADLLKFEENEKVQVILFPPSVYLESLSVQLKSSSIMLGSQNNHSESSGAYTGELSASILASCGASYGLVGHSERRAYFAESEDFLLKKTKALLENHLNPVYCIGETLEERESGAYLSVIAKQIANLFSLSAEEFSRLIIAYEPVWAIGTGKTASAEQAQEIHAFIRKEIAEAYSEEMAEACSILYGGSCKPSNAEELFSQADVDGGLIGGASLNAADFNAIINSF